MVVDPLLGLRDLKRIGRSSEHFAHQRIRIQRE
jgi:hypothetical protein